MSLRFGDRANAAQQLKSKERSTSCELWPNHHHNNHHPATDVEIIQLLTS